MIPISKLLYVPMLFLVIFCNIIYFSLPNTAYAQTDESAIKAEWVYTLIPYIRWINRPYKELTICTIGREPVHTRLEEIVRREEARAKEEKAKMPPTIYVEKKSFASDFKNCHMLYVSVSENNKLSDILGKVEDKQILTVSSLNNFADNGGIIEFVISTDGVVVRINEKPAEKEKIVIDSDLLGFAKRIYK